MSCSLDFIHGLVFGIAHADTLYVETDDEEMYEATGIVFMFGFIQLTFFW
jgi:hypothetical protein